MKSKMAPLFITGTEESAGKTLVTLGLVSDLIHTVPKLGFIKPLGIARLRAGRDGIDLDAMLIDRVCTMHSNIKDMCPVTLGHSDWPQVTPREAERMLQKMREAYERISAGRDLMVIEGIGSAALGSSLGLSNARIAATFGARALLVGRYGTMQFNPFDALVEDASFFAANGVPVIGALINKVPADLLDAYEPYARGVLETLGMRLFGLIPEDSRLRTFRFLQVAEVLRGELLFGAAQSDQVIKRVRVGAMTPHRAINYLEPGTLIITPGDREDTIVTICLCATRPQGGPSGLVLSGGERPHDRILELLKESRIPTFLAEEDSYTVASKIHDMPLRIQPTDEEKINLAQQLVMDQVDLEGILQALSS